MHLLPLIFENFHTCRPSHQPKRQELGEIDLLMPFLVSQQIQKLTRVPTFVYYHPPRSEINKKEASAEAAADKDEFQVSLNVQHFTPEEITVKVSGDDTIIVEAKHEEKQDEHGHVSRQIVRKYVLPKGHDINEVQSKLSSDGMLTITAPKSTENKIEENTIPIQQSDVSSTESIQKEEPIDERKAENDEEK